MKVIAHEHVGVQLHLVIGQGATQFFQEHRTIPVVAKDRAAVVASAGDVVVPAWNENSQRPGRGVLYCFSTMKVNSKDLTPAPHSPLSGP